MRLNPVLFAALKSPPTPNRARFGFDDFADVGNPERLPVRRAENGSENVGFHKLGELVGFQNPANGATFDTYGEPTNDAGKREIQEFKAQLAVEAAKKNKRREGHVLDGGLLGYQQPYYQS